LPRRPPNPPTGAAIRRPRWPGYRPRSSGSHPRPIHSRRAGLRQARPGRQRPGGGGYERSSVFSLRARRAHRAPVEWRPIAGRSQNRSLQIIGPRAPTRGTSSSSSTRDLARPLIHARTWGRCQSRQRLSSAITPRGGLHNMNDTTGAVAAQPENRILRALPAEERDQLAGRLHHVSLPAKTVLFEPGQVIRAVHFPLDGVISLVTPMGKGDTVEVATIGNEGVVGVPLVAGGSLAVRAISQVGGHALRMEADAFMAE